jgi:hypothetical protein
MDYRLSQQLIPEVVGEMSVVATVDVLLGLLGGRVDLVTRLLECLDAEFLGAFLGKSSAELAVAACDEIDVPHEFRDLRCWLLKVIIRWFPFLLTASLRVRRNERKARSAQSLPAREMGGNQPREIGPPSSDRSS